MAASIRHAFIPRKYHQFTMHNLHSVFGHLYRSLRSSFLSFCTVYGQTHDIKLLSPK